MLHALVRMGSWDRTRGQEPGDILKDSSVLSDFPCREQRALLVCNKKNSEKRLYGKINHHLYPISILSSSGIPALRQPGQIQRAGHTQEQGSDSKALQVLRLTQNGWDLIIKTHSVSATIHRGVKGSREH